MVFEPSATHLCPRAIPAIWWGIQLWELGREPPESSSFPFMVVRGLLFQVVLIPMSQSTPNLCWALDLVILVGDQAADFIHTWLAECFTGQSHIYSCLIGKVSTLTHFPLEPGCEDYSFLDQTVEDFEHGLGSILKDSLYTPEQDASLDEADAIPSLVSSGFLHSVSTLLSTSRLQLAPNIKSQ